MKKICLFVVAAAVLTFAVAGCKPTTEQPKNEPVVYMSFDKDHTKIEWADPSLSSIAHFKNLNPAASALFMSDKNGTLTMTVPGQDIRLDFTYTGDKTSGSLTIKGKKIMDSFDFPATTVAYRVAGNVITIGQRAK